MYVGVYLRLKTYWFVAGIREYNPYTLYSPDIVGKCQKPTIQEFQIYKA